MERTALRAAADAERYAERCSLAERATPVVRITPQTLAKLALREATITPRRGITYGRVAHRKQARSDSAAGDLKRRADVVEWACTSTIGKSRASL